MRSIADFETGTKEPELGCQTMIVATVGVGRVDTTRIDGRAGLLLMADLLSKLKPVAMGSCNPDYKSPANKRKNVHR